MSDGELLAETPHTQLVCRQDRGHYGIDRRTGAAYRVCACNCQEIGRQPAQGRTVC